MEKIYRIGFGMVNSLERIDGYKECLFLFGNEEKYYLIRGEFDYSNKYLLTKYELIEESFKLVDRYYTDIEKKGPITERVVEIENGKIKDREELISKNFIEEYKGSKDVIEKIKKIIETNKRFGKDDYLTFF